MDPASAAAILSAIAAVGGPIAGSFFGGTGTDTGFTDEQRNLLNDLIQGIQTGSGPIGAPFDTGRFQREVGDPIREQFQQRTVPQIQQRFAGQGQMRGTSSGDTITRAGADLEAEIARGAFDAEQKTLDRILAGTKVGLTDPGKHTTEKDSPVGDFFNMVGAGGAKEFDLQNFLNMIMPGSGGGGGMQGSRPPLRGTTTPAQPPPVRY